MKNLALTFYTCYLFLGPLSIQAQKTISIDFSSSSGAIKKLTSVNSGPLSLVSGTSELCYRQIGVEMIRTHDLHGPTDYYGYTNFYNPITSTFNYSFKSPIESNYNWGPTDVKMNDITRPGFIPFFRLGISAPVKGGKALTPPPRDSDQVNFTQFAGICKRTAMHYTDEWNKGFKYNIPYWEVWNEPNNKGFWTGTAQEYYLMYKQVVDSIRSFNTNLKVGGPGAAKNAFFTGGNYLTLNHEYISNFFQYCKNDSVPLDFYSFHTYDRKNPYHIKTLADTISYFLDQNGFKKTELIVSEMNVNLDGFVNSGKGCSHLASMLIAATDTRISKMIWYRGVDLQPLCNSDVGSKANLQLQGYAYQFFNELYDSTNTWIASTGNEFEENNFHDSLNNFMVLAGKSGDQNMVKILISNYESVHQKLDLNLRNLPWNVGNQIQVSVQKVNDNGYFTDYFTLTGNSILNFSLNNITDASTYLVTLKNIETLSGGDFPCANDFLIYPNPVHSYLTFSIPLTGLHIFNELGQTIFSEKNPTQNLSVSQWKNGVYFLTSDQGSKKLLVCH